MPIAEKLDSKLNVPQTNAPVYTQLPKSAAKDER